MELKVGDVLVFKHAQLKDIIITIWGIDCNRRVRYSYGLADENKGYFFTNESNLLKEAKILSPLEVELL